MTCRVETSIISLFTAVVLTGCGSGAVASGPPSATGSPASNQAASAANVPASAGASRATINLVLNLSQVSYAPVYVAQEQGFFSDEGLNVNIVPSTTSSAQQIPLLVRGDADALIVAPGVPAYLNALDQGFAIWIVAGSQVSKPGHASESFLVRKDLWDSGEVKKVEDLAGRKIAYGPSGTPLYFFSYMLLQKAGIGDKATNVDAIRQGALDFPLVLKNKVVDAESVTEPLGSKIIDEGLGLRIADDGTVLDGYQASGVALSEQFLSSRRADAVKFIRAYIRGMRFINARGRWDDTMLNIVAKYTKTPVETLKQLGYPVYDNDGHFDTSWIPKQEDVWLKAGLMKKAVDPAKILDDSVRQEALKGLK